jgi:hypothetical protein
MSTATAISVKAPKVEKEISEGKKPEGTIFDVTVNFDKPDTIEEAITAYGAAPVLDGFWSDFVVYIQGVARKELEKGKTPAEIQATISTLKPGVKRVGTVDIQAALKAKLSSMTSEEKAAYIAELMGE